MAKNAPIPASKPKRGLPGWLLIPGGVAALAVVAGLVAPYFVPWDKLKDQAAAAASKSLGRKLSIGKVEVSLFSGVHVKDIRLDNAPGFSKEPLFSNADAKVSFSILSLFTGKVVLSSISFDQPQLLLETDAHGRNNLPPSTGLRAGSGSESAAKTKLAAKAAAKPNAPSEDASLPVLVNLVEVKDASLVIRNHQKNSDTAVRGFNLRLTGISLAEAGASRLELDMVVEANGRKIPLALRSGFRLDLDAGAVEITDCVLTLPAVKADLKGTVKNFAAPSLDLQGGVVVDAAKVPELLPATDAKGEPQNLKMGGTLTVKLSAKGPASLSKDLVADLDAESSDLEVQGLKTGHFGATLRLRKLQADLAEDMDLYKGHLSVRGGADLAPAEPTFHADVVLKNVDFGPMVDDLAAASPQSGAWQQVKGKVSGALSFKADAKGQGLAEPAFTKHLQATASFDLKDGVIRKTDVQESLASAIPDPQTQAVLRGDIKFSDAVGNLVVEGPKTTLKSFQLGSGADWRSGVLYLQASGSQFKDGPLDYRVVPHFNPAQVQVAGDVGRALQDERGWPTFDYIAYGGPTAAQAKADFSAGIQKAATKAVTDKVQDLLKNQSGNALKGLFGQ
jgi:uncharacterized protein involved in outer membrane biogenesis